MIDKEDLLKELQRIMPRARWHHLLNKDGVAFRALMDPNSPINSVNSRVDLHVGTKPNSQSRLEMPVVGLEYLDTNLTTGESAAIFADEVRHILMFRCAWWLTETAKRAREALGGYEKATDPINPFILQTPSQPPTDRLDPPEGWPTR